MAFGQELRDFVAGFDKGYKMFKSPQEKADEKSDRDWRDKSRARTETEWGQADTKFEQGNQKFSQEQEDASYARSRRGIQEESDSVALQHNRLVNEGMGLDIQAKKDELAPNSSFISGALGNAGVEAEPPPSEPDTPAPTTAPTNTAPSAAGLPLDFADPSTDGSQGQATDGQAAINDMIGKHDNYYDAAHDSIKDGLLSLVDTAGLANNTALPAPNQQAAAGAMMSGKLKPVKPEDVNAVMQAIRKQFPDNSDEQIGMKAFGAIREYYNKIGQPEKATEASAQLLQYYQQAFNKYSAVSAAAAQSGDTDGAIKAAIKAYANIPDGKDLKAVKLKDGSYNVTFTDTATGKPISRRVLTPDQIGSMAMKLASPDNFNKVLLAAAGDKNAMAAASPGYKDAMANVGNTTAIPDMSEWNKDEQTQYIAARKEFAPEKAKARTPEELDKISTIADTAVTNIIDSVKDETNNQYLEGNKPHIVRMAGNLLINKANKNLSPTDAAETIMDAIVVDDDNPGIPTGKVKGQDDDGNIIFQVPGHSDIRISPEDYTALHKIWAKKADERVKADAEAGARAKADAGRSAAIEEARKPVINSLDSVLANPKPGLGLGIPLGY